MDKNKSGEPTSLTKKEIKAFRDMLIAKRQEILGNAQTTLQENLMIDASDLPDEMDLASSEYLQSLDLRHRGREMGNLRKIELALRKIDEGSYGVCVECGEFIGKKRLENRPQAEMCIRCKEDQEREEKAYS